MNRDGGDLQQLTFDDRVNWFPHLSPDASSIVYLSYAHGTVGHPADKNVVIRSMTPDGHLASDLVAFHGGQGSLNVNSWSPDSTHFAYVEYPLKPN